MPRRFRPDVPPPARSGLLRPGPSHSSPAQRPGPRCWSSRSLPRSPRFSSRCVSPSGAIGLMQVMPATGEEMGVPRGDLARPRGQHTCRHGLLDDAFPRGLEEVRPGGDGLLEGAAPGPAAHHRRVSWRAAHARPRRFGLRRPATMSARS